nr:MAG TPA: hypothetical protein [Caudoviricetes sp.]
MSDCGAQYKTAIPRRACQIVNLPKIMRAARSAPL